MERTKAEQEFALTGGVFDRLLKNKTGNIAGNLTKIFPKSQTPRGFPGGGGGRGMGGFGIDRYINGMEINFNVRHSSCEQIDFSDERRAFES